MLKIGANKFRDPGGPHRIKGSYSEKSGPSLAGSRKECGQLFPLLPPGAEEMGDGSKRAP